MKANLLLWEGGYMEIDEKRVRAAQNGSEQAFTEIYAVFYKDMYKFACFMMGNTADAEDIVADAVLDIWQQIGELRNPLAFKSWVFAIIANKCKRAMKRHKEIPVDFETELEGLFIGKEYREENMELRLEMLEVSRVFKELKKEERMIIAYRVFGGYSSSEVAEVMKMNSSTVRSKLSRAFDKMKKGLKEEGGKKI